MGCGGSKGPNMSVYTKEFMGIIQSKPIFSNYSKN
jgi:hypothetical protein